MMAGALSQGLSAGGNAYNWALSEGYNKDQAKTYATLVGASESALQYVQGGISKLGGISTDQLLTKVATIDNALLRVAAAAGVKIGSEVAEEELQLFLEPLYRTLVFGEDYSAPAMEEILYTALLTAITTAVIEGKKHHIVLQEGDREPFGAVQGQNQGEWRGCDHLRRDAQRCSA